MNTIFKYINYRLFLADYYEEKKKTTRFFSYRFFAQKAGIKSPVFLKQVIEGDRNLTRPMIEKFINALGLNKKEAVFFRHLTEFNQARTAQEKQEHYSVMVTMTDYVKQHQLKSDQYSYFEKWYNCVIRELACLMDFQGDFSLLAKAVLPPITVREAKRSVELLQRLKLLKQMPDGRYRQIDASITSGQDIISMVRRAHNSKMLDLSRKANDNLPPEVRNISNITMGISKECYNVLLAEFDAFKERIVSIVNHDNKSSQVYQFCLSLFPLSNEVSNKKNPKNGEKKP
ncbi:MAG: TIGR02147 family protein [Fibrobacteria bacterium]|nr:TIGR02147 family protein [Fibrobacteria bacterium]